MFLSQTYHIFVTKYGCKNTQIFFYDNSLSINRSTFEALLATIRTRCCFQLSVGYFASNHFNYRFLHLFYWISVGIIAGFSEREELTNFHTAINWSTLDVWMFLLWRLIIRAAIHYEIGQLLVANQTSFNLSQSLL